MPGHSCAGEPVIYDAIQAVRDWLAANTLTARPEAQTDEVRRMLAQAEVSDDDLELDSEDVDEEMIEALREVIDDDDKKLLKLLKKAEQAPTDTKQQRDAIRDAPMLGVEQRHRWVIQARDVNDAVQLILAAAAAIVVDGDREVPRRVERAEGGCHVACERDLCGCETLGDLVAERPEDDARVRAIAQQRRADVVTPRRRKPS